MSTHTVPENPALATSPGNATAATTTPDAVRQTMLMMNWQLRRSAASLPLLITVQVFLAVATVIGYGLLMGDPPHQAALYLATGAPTVTLIMVGLVLTPQMIAQAKTEGSLDWLRTLPVPRGIFLAADLLVWTVIALPGMILGIIAGAVRFDIQLSLTWWLPLAAILVSLTAASVGYAIACVAQPAVAMLVSQMLVFIVMLFSPVSYPAQRLPQWLATVHEWLPIQPMADLMRAGLVCDEFSVTGRSIAVLAAWCIAAVAGALAVLQRRA